MRLDQFIALSLLCFVGCGESESYAPRVIVLGVDGLDPDMVRDHMAAGRMPHFQALADLGGLTDLGTSWPPQSPVAWSNFITGADPGHHGLYDFVHVDRSNYGLATSMTRDKEPWLDFNLFGLPVLAGGGKEQLREFPAFWDVLADAGVPVSIHRIPANFPLQDLSDAVVFPDMGTPDLLGAASGRASLWFERSDLADARGWSVRSGGSYTMRAVRAERELYLDGDGHGVLPFDDKLMGPADSSTPVRFHLDLTGSAPALGVELGEDGHEEVNMASLGDWSDWMPMTFADAGNVSGWTRFLFQSADPFVVYAAPVQMDPFSPSQPVSQPESASADLAEAIGPYYTQGFPDAYKAYKEGLLDTGEFLSQSDTVFVERVDMLDWALEEFDQDGGLLFFYTGSLDMRCHMLWHCADADHPHQEPAGDYDQLPAEYSRLHGRGLKDYGGLSYGEQLDRTYFQVDDLLGYLMAQVQERWPDCEVIVMSDHGFAPLHRVMNINDWLVQEGYLVLNEKGASGSIAVPHGEHGEILWQDSFVDWSQTRAYAVGFNGVILNRVNREPHGIVEASAADALLTEMRAKLQAFRDEDGAAVFQRVLLASEAFDSRGARFSLAPDLQLGFSLGYGASDPSALGKVLGGPILEDNDSRWSGSHLMDPDVVRGTLAWSRPGDLALKTPQLTDVTATLYELFSVERPTFVEGTSFFPIP